MAKEHLYILAYDIADAKRWRRVFKLMKGHGRWLQLSVFQCRLTTRRRLALTAKIEQIVDPKEDHVLVVDIGPATSVAPRIESIGKSYRPIERKAIIL